MTRYPSALNIPFKPWCYPQGYFLMGLEKLWNSTGDRQYYDYILSWANQVVNPDGTLRYFKGKSMDDMMAGSVIVWAYKQTKDEKFRKAAEIIRKSYDDYPRTTDGVFWHGRGTVGQIWVCLLYTSTLIFVTEPLSDRTTLFNPIHIVFKICCTIGKFSNLILVERDVESGLP